MCTLTPTKKEKKVIHLFSAPAAGWLSPFHQAMREVDSVDSESEARGVHHGASERVVELHNLKAATLTPTPAPQQLSRCSVTATNRD